MMFPLTASMVIACAIAFSRQSSSTSSPQQISALVVADSLTKVFAHADSTPLLTVDALTRMTAFWTAYMKEPLSVRDTASWKVHNRELLRVGFFGKDHNYWTSKGEVVNYIALSAMSPSVAADFKQAELTSSQWEGFRQALFMESFIVGLVEAGNANPPLPTSVAGKNIEFLNAHQQEYDALLATGMMDDLIEKKP